MPNLVTREACGERDADFGASSSRAMRVLAAVKAAFGVTISPRALIGDATIAGIAPELDRTARNADASAIASDRPRDGEAPIRHRPRSAALTPVAWRDAIT